MDAALVLGLLPILVIGGLAVALLWRRAADPLWPRLLAVAVCGLLWSGGELVASQATTHDTLWLGLVVLYSGSIPMPALWWGAVLRYARLHGSAAWQLGPAWERVPLAVAAGFWLVMLSNPWHGAFLEPVVGGRNPYAAGFYALFAVNASEVVASALLCGLLARRHTDPGLRRGSALLAAAPLLMLACNAFYVVSPWYLPTHFTGAALAVSALLVGVVAWGTRSLLRLPAALSGVLKRDPQGVLILGANGRVYFRNPAADALLAGLGVGEVDPLPALAARLRRDDGAPLGGAPALEHALLAADATGLALRDPASDRWLWMAAVPVPGGAGARGAGLALRLVDITAARQAQEQRRALELRLQETERQRGLGVLAGGIAHDFNNRLAIVLGNADLAFHDADEGTRAHLREIQEAALGASQLTQQLLATAGRGGVRSEPLDLSHEVAAAARALTPTLPAGVTLRTGGSEALLSVRADRQQLQQVVAGLVENAREALEGEVGWITLDTGWLEVAEASSLPLTRPLKPGRYACLEVADSGAGMDAEICRHAVEPFFSTRGPGRGLGLSAAAGIAHAHGGALALESAPGVGTRVRMLLPAGAGGVRPAPAPRADAASPWQGGGLVLVVDDEAPVRAVAERMLQQLGFETLAAGGGREAVERFRARHRELRFVLLDLVMPDIPGDAVLAALRRIAPEVPVVISSGFSEEDAMRRLAGGKAVGFVPKPYRLEALAERLRAMLEGERR